MAMATLDNQQTWVPYETTKDCSQGFCSMYCPQWCYIIFPPPPPLGFEDESSGPNFSPLVIAIIGILASAFLLVSYYTIISKYCGNFDSLRRRLNRHRPDGDTEENLGALRHETWHISPSNGLDESLINKITVCKYRRGEGLVEGTDCSVCLSEFREDESLRLLPKCNHAFHLQCIDTWLESHSNCPLCRANIVSINPVPLQLPAPPEPEDNLPIVESERNNEMVVAVEDLDVDREEETSSLESNGDASKDPSHSPCDLGGQEESHSIEIRDEGIQSIRRSLSMDSLCRDRVSIADVLGVSMEEEFLAMTDHEHGVGSSRRSEGEQRKGSSRSRASLHSVMSPVPMKRSFSSGKFCFTRHGRGRSAVLPI